MITKYEFKQFIIRLQIWWAKMTYLDEACRLYSKKTAPRWAIYRFNLAFIWTRPIERYNFRKIKQEIRRLEKKLNK